MDIEKIIARSFSDNKYYNQVPIDFNISLEANSRFSSDTRRVTSVLDNVISNAVKYCDINKPRSYINIHVYIDELECVIKIEDNGIGMSEDTLKNAFRMFFRGTNKVAGSGLGLFIVKEILDKIGGKIELESVIGGGTTTMIYLTNKK